MKTVQADVVNVPELAALLRRHLAEGVDHVHLTRAACEMLADALERIPAYVTQDYGDAWVSLPRAPCADRACSDLRELGEHLLCQASTFEVELGADPQAQQLARALCESIDGLEALLATRAMIEVLGGCVLALLDGQHPGHFARVRTDLEPTPEGN